MTTHLIATLASTISTSVVFVRVGIAAVAERADDLGAVDHRAVLGLLAQAAGALLETLDVLAQHLLEDQAMLASAERLAEAARIFSRRIRSSSMFRTSSCAIIVSPMTC